METTNGYIEAECRLFVCLECRTKVGWRHQIWCARRDKTSCSCKDCLYYHEKRGICIHPALKRKERIAHEKTEYPI